MKIFFIGMGNMGQALVSGMLNKDIIDNSAISFYEVNQEIIKDVENTFGIKYREIDDNINEFDIIFIAVKPQVFYSFSLDEKMSLLPKLLNNSQIIVSIMAGVSIKSLLEFFVNSKKIVRCMPNTPLLIGEGMSVLSPSEDITDKELDIIKVFFKAVGQVEVMKENYLDAVTGLSGSGPAFVFTFIEAMIQGGILSGLSYSTAKRLAVQTVIGATKMVNEDTLIEELRHKVTSPAGTTIKGMSILEKNAFRGTVIEAIYSAAKRSEELSKK